MNCLKQKDELFVLKSCLEPIKWYEDPSWGCTPVSLTGVSGVCNVFELWFFVYEMLPHQDSHTLCRTSET